MSKRKLERPNTIKTIQTIFPCFPHYSWSLNRTLYKKSHVLMSAVSIAAYSPLYLLWSSVSSGIWYSKVQFKASQSLYAIQYVQALRLAQGHIDNGGQKTFFFSYTSSLERRQASVTRADPTRTTSKTERLLHSEDTTTEESPWLATFWFPTSNTEERKKVRAAAQWQWI